MIRLATSINLSAIILSVYGLSLLGIACDAYSLYGVPVQWVLKLFPVFGAALLLLCAKPVKVPGLNLFFIFLAWAICLTLVTSLSDDYAQLTPSDSTTPYALYVSLRILNLICFAAIIYITFYICQIGLYKKTIIILLGVATLASLYSFYSYYGQVFFDEYLLNRNRIGTGGFNNPVYSGTQIHRLVGSFREPLFLASFMILPISLVFSALFGWWRYILAVLFLTVLLLTNSLSGQIALFGGFIAAVCPFLGFLPVWPQKRPDSGPNRWRYFIKLGIYKIRRWNLSKAVLAVVFVLFISIQTFNWLAIPNWNNAESKSVTVNSRFINMVLKPLNEPIKTKQKQTISPSTGKSHFPKLVKSKFFKLVKRIGRDKPYRYVLQEGIPWLGYGGGNANIRYTQFTKFTMISSFLNLYINIGMSYGIVGLVLLTVFIVYPLVLVVRIVIKSRNSESLLKLFWVTIPFIGWMLLFAASFEELTMSFAISYALLVYNIQLVHKKSAELYSTTFAGKAMKTRGFGGKA
jgi:hypothetical protein